MAQLNLEDRIKQQLGHLMFVILGQSAQLEELQARVQAQDQAATPPSDRPSA